MSGFGVLGFDNASGGAAALDYVKDAFKDISVPANSNSGFSSTVSKNPLQHYYGNDVAPRWASKILWIKDLTLVEDRTLWISDRPTYDVVWHEDFIAAKGYVFGTINLVNQGSGVYVDVNRIGDGFGVGGVIRRVQWIVEGNTAAAATAQLSLDGSNTTTIDFSSAGQSWSGQPDFNAYTSASSNETRNIHDFRVSALQNNTLRVTGVVVYYEIDGGQIDCFGGSTYVDKSKITTIGTSLALPTVQNFRGGRAKIYATELAAFGVTTSAVTDVTSIATGNSGTNLLTVQTGHGTSFLAGTVVWGQLSATHYIGNVLSVSSDTLTMGVTLPQGISTTLYQVWQAGHTFSVNQSLSVKSFDFNPYLPLPVIGSTIPSGVLAYQDPNLRYRVWGGTLQVIPGTSLNTGFGVTFALGKTFGIDLSHATSFLQVDGQFQSLEFEFMTGQSGYIQATFGIDGMNCFNINEAFPGPGIFRKAIAVDGGPGWHSVTMNRGASHQGNIISRIVGYNNALVNGPSLGVLANLSIGQTFLQRDRQNATLSAYGNVTRYFADSLYVKGPWTRGTTRTVAGGAYWFGSTSTNTLRFQYYGSAISLIGAIGANNNVTIDGLAQSASMGFWLGLSLATDFHTVAFNCDTATGTTTRLEAIDVLNPSGAITSTQNFAPLVDLFNPAVDNQSIEYNVAKQLRVKQNGIQTTNILNGNVTEGKLAPLNRQLSSSSGSFSTSSGSYVDVTNLSVTITVVGRNGGNSNSTVLVSLVPDGSGTATSLRVDRGNTNADFQLAILRDASFVGESYIDSTAIGATSVTLVTIGNLFVLDDVAPGTYTYKVQARIVTTGSTPLLTVANFKLIAIEL